MRPDHLDSCQCNVTFYSDSKLYKTQNSHRKTLKNNFFKLQQHFFVNFSLKIKLYRLFLTRKSFFFCGAARDVRSARQSVGIWRIPDLHYLQAIKCTRAKLVIDRFALGKSWTFFPFAHTPTSELSCTFFFGSATLLSSRCILNVRCWCFSQKFY